MPNLGAVTARVHDLHDRELSILIFSLLEDLVTDFSRFNASLGKLTTDVAALVAADTAEEAAEAAAAAAQAAADQAAVDTAADAIDAADATVVAATPVVS
jgi:hypothetical protein